MKASKTDPGPRPVPAATAQTPARGTASAAGGPRPRAASRSTLPASKADPAQPEPSLRQSPGASPFRDHGLASGFEHG